MKTSMDLKVLFSDVLVTGRTGEYTIIVIFPLLPVNRACKDER